MYKPESWYKLQGGRILVQITPLQYFAPKWGMGVFSGVGLHSEFDGTSKYNIDIIATAYRPENAETNLQVTVIFILEIVENDTPYRP